MREREREREGERERAGTSRKGKMCKAGIAYAHLTAPHSRDYMAMYAK